jgi:hypothetical protein
MTVKASRQRIAIFSRRADYGHRMHMGHGNRWLRPWAVTYSDATVLDIWWIVDLGRMTVGLLLAVPAALGVLAVWDRRRLPDLRLVEPHCFSPRSARTSSPGRMPESLARDRSRSVTDQSAAVP